MKTDLRDGKKVSPSGSTSWSPCRNIIALLCFTTAFSPFVGNYGIGIASQSAWKTCLQVHKYSTGSHEKSSHLIHKWGIHSNRSQKGHLYQGEGLLFLPTRRSRFCTRSSAIRSLCANADNNWYQFVMAYKSTTYSPVPVSLRDRMSPPQATCF